MPLIHPGRISVVLCALALSISAFFLYTWHNDFLFYYHTDEPGKVTQVMSGQRKFNHPLLLLTATELVARARGVLQSPQDVAISGRFVSATAAALAVGLMTLLGVRLFGSWAGLFGGVLLLTNPTLFELSHYLKEDCCLILGVAAFFAALSVYERAESLPAAALLGAACGLAVSGKYIGVISLVVALPTIFFFGLRRPLGSNLARAAILLAAAAAVFFVLDFQAILNFSFTGQGVGTEFDYMGTHERTKHLFQNLIAVRIPEVISWPVIIFAVAGLAAAVSGIRRDTSRALWPILAFAIIYLICIQCTPLARLRYLLPIVFVISLFSTGGIHLLGRWLSPAIVLALCTLVLLLPNALSTIGLLRELPTDSRRELTAWIEKNLPPSVHILADDRSHLKDLWSFDKVPRPLPVIFEDDDVLKIGTPEELRARGITHIVISEETYQWLFNPRHLKGPARDAFIASHFPADRQLWQSPKGRISYIHPGLRLFALPPP